MNQTHLSSLIDKLSTPPDDETATLELAGESIEVCFSHEDGELPPYSVDGIKLGKTWIAVGSLFAPNMVRAMSWQVTRQMQAKAEQDAGDAAIEAAEFAAECAL